MLLQDGSMLGQKSLFLLGDDIALTALFLSFELLLSCLSLTLLLINNKFLFP